MHIHRSAVVPYRPEQMYCLVNRVDDYPKFLRHCQHARILEHSHEHMLAEIGLGVGGIGYRFTTRNQLLPHHTIAMRLERGPFARLTGEWRFEQQPAGGTEVTLALEFDFGKGLMSFAYQRLFETISHEMVEAFCSRACEVYGHVPR